MRYNNPLLRDVGYLCVTQNSPLWHPPARLARCEHARGYGCPSNKAGSPSGRLLGSAVRPRSHCCLSACSGTRINRIQPRAFRCGAMGEEQCAGSRWASALGTLPGGCRDRVVYSSWGGFKLMGEQGNAVCCICESSFDGWADGAADVGLSWREA